MNINKKDERIFNPVKVQRKGRWKWIVLGFLAFMLVFGTATLFYLSDKLDSFGLGGIMEIFEEDSDNTVLSDTGESSATILFMSVSSSQTAESGKKQIYFLVLANLAKSSFTSNLLLLIVVSSVDSIISSLSS